MRLCHFDITFHSLLYGRRDDGERCYIQTHRFAAADRRETYLKSSARRQYRVDYLHIR